MRSHEAEPMARPVVALNDLVEQREKAKPILILSKENLLQRAACGDVIRPSGNLDAKRPSHSDNVRRRARSGRRRHSFVAPPCVFRDGV